MAIMKKMKRGFTLIELMIVVVIIGVLAALAIYGVQRYVANSKSAEARQMLGRISKDQLTYYEGENQAYAVLSFGETAAISASLCRPAAAIWGGAYPQAEKKQPPEPVFFRTDDGWDCLKTSLTTPLYYEYSMLSPNQGGTWPSSMEPGEVGDTFTVVAQGDLDGDSVTSQFILGGQILEDSSDNLVLVLATTVEDVDEEE